MEILPILSAMRHNKTGPVLIAMQVAITLAIVSNAAFIIQERVEKMNRPTGMDHNNIIFASSYGFSENYEHQSAIRKDVEALESMPGVRAAGFITQIPLSGGGAASCYHPAPPDDSVVRVCANYYSGNGKTAEALGIEISEGRWFRREEIEYRPGENYAPKSAVITRALADALYGKGVPVVGKLLYDTGDDSSRIIGVIKHMQGAWVWSERIDNVVFFGNITDPPGANYAIRVEPGERDRLLPLIEAKLQDINRDRVVLRTRAHVDYIADSYTGDSAMVQMLAGVSGLLIAVCALGIVGLAAFNVNQRKKQIGTRRALGARRADILRYFLVESLAITGIGILPGVVLAFALSWWLGVQFNLPALDWRFVPPVILGVLVISQLAVLGPARRASGISPALATRSV